MGHYQPAVAIITVYLVTALGYAIYRWVWPKAMPPGMTIMFYLAVVCIANAVVWYGLPQ